MGPWLWYLLVHALLSSRCLGGAACPDASLSDIQEQEGDQNLDCLDTDFDQSLHLIQRRAKAKEAITPHGQLKPAGSPEEHKARAAHLPTAARIDLALCSLLGLVSWPPALHATPPAPHGEKQSLAQSFATSFLGSGSIFATFQSLLQDVRQVPGLLRQHQNTGWAAVVIALWGTSFCTLVCVFLHSVLCARARRATEELDNRISCAASPARADASSFLEKGQQIGWKQCLTFGWMDSFLGGDSFDLFTTKGSGTGALKQAWHGEVRQHGALKASLWRALFQAVGRRNLALLFACAWLAAFLEFIGMVLALDVILFLLESESEHDGGVDALQTTLAVLGLLFVVPLAYRFLSSVVCMLDGHLATVISADITTMLYEKSLRLPAGAMYHSHVAEGGANASQLAATMAASAAQEWQQMFRTLALLSAAPLLAVALVALLLWHMGLPGLLGIAYILPGSCIAILVVKWAISWRHEYQLCHSLRLRWLRALTTSRRARQSLGFEDALRGKICAAREQELAANENYSVVVSLLIANLQSVVWLVVVGSLFSSVLLGAGSPARNVWVVLQIVASLQACCSLVVSGLRRALCLPSSLQRLECFLKQPEMPLDVVRQPALHLGAPLVHVSGNFSFEEGGPLVLRNLDFSVQRGERVALLGPSGSGKTALIQAILGELFPCGLSFVSATHQRIYWPQEPWISRKTWETALSEKPVCGDFLQGRRWQTPCLSEVTPRERARVMLSSLPGSETPELFLLDDALRLLEADDAQEMLHARIFTDPPKHAGCVVAMTSATARSLEKFDRIVLLSSGRILAQGPPAEVMATADLDMLVSPGTDISQLVRSQNQVATEMPAKALHSEEDAPEASAQPLSVLQKALLRQSADACLVDLQNCSGRVLEQAESMVEVGKIVVSWLQAAGCWQLFFALVSVLLQRCAQLTQLLVLARWGDSAMSSRGCDHKAFAIGLLVALASNATLLVISEWACSCVAREASHRIHARLLSSFCQLPGAHAQRAWSEAFNGDLAHVDSVVLSSFLSGFRSCIGTVIQQAFILTIAPQWLACVVLLPLYACVCYFCWVYLSTSALAARSSRLFLAEAQDIMDETLVDPVSVRANLLSGRSAARVGAAAKASAAFASMFPAASRSWLCFRVALCLSFAASACALHVLLCDEAKHVGVGSLGLVVSLLFAFLGDCEAAAEVSGQATIALSALGRVLRLAQGSAAEKDRVCEPAFAAEIEISGEEMPSQLTSSSNAVCDSSGPLLAFADAHLEVVAGRSLGELSAKLTPWQDYYIVSVNKVAFDAKAMAAALLDSRGTDLSSPSRLALGLRHVSTMQGLSVAFEKVSFSYGSSGLVKPVLANLTFHVPSGAHVGIEGPPGSGKSTLLAAASGFFQCGGVRVQGRTPGEALKGLIGFVSQEPVIWEGSWRDNLDLEDRFTDEALWEVLRGVNLDAAAAAKPQGLATILPGDGNALGSEQRYLLSLARVALRQPALLLLDDCSAATASEIQKSTSCQTKKAMLSSWFRNSTVLAAVSSEAQAAAMGLSEVLRLRDGHIAA